ncbi:hypothetical protein PM3016_2208 [Paenibacillus mucilaginosus 3016]|uniref:Uncharacterized protein n=1 Tax=Paenibacillus mucilaginosus 3016 TaxID=1116391 RepID=H6NHA1_9BACL|nr:YxiJ-like family protein [Paenibacillus mucilaginosus]AFC29096.1 hypothetical protein PM3016_2208 [Paenibacillus mucilaginosus 3016]WFA17838.1 hypothetical protein ERY13_11400 [Paenibacillus mucilaginosus]
MHIFGFSLDRNELWIAASSFKEAVTIALSKSPIIKKYVQLDNKDFIELPGAKKEQVSDFLKDKTVNYFIGQSGISFDEEEVGEIVAYHRKPWQPVPTVFLPPPIDSDAYLPEVSVSYSEVPEEREREGPDWLSSNTDPRIQKLKKMNIATPFPSRDISKMMVDFRHDFQKLGGQAICFNADFAEYCMVIAGTLSYVLTGKSNEIPQIQIDYIKLSFFTWYPQYKFIEGRMSEYKEFNRRYENNEEVRMLLLEFLSVKAD